jgi:predicted Zn-dependent protease
MVTVKQGKSNMLRLLVALTAMLCALAAGAQSSRVPLPDMGNSASTVLSDREEAEYARELIRQLRHYELLIEDPLIHDYFADMGFRLVSRSNRPDHEFIFVVMDEGAINAFAAPGGVVALHSGLILAADDPHEVAGVLAHEIAHVTQLHLYRAFEKAKAMTLPIALATLGMILAGGGDGDVITGALMSAQAMSAQMRINFTRHNEIEADRIGIQTLADAGYDAEGMAEFFGKLNRLTRVNGEGPPEFLRTHPVTVNRIAEARDRAANLPKPDNGDDGSFYLIQARLRALYEDKPEDAVRWFREELKQDNAEPRVNGLNYGLAIALQRHLDYDESRALLLQLAETDPYQVLYQLQLAELDLAEGDVKAARSRLAGLHRDFPGNHAIAMGYAAALIHDEDPGQAAQAADILRRQTLKRADDPSLYALYARAANLAGDTVRSGEALAESYYQQGSTTDAIEQLERLVEDPALDYYQRSRIEARLLEMRLETEEGLEQPEQESTAR